MSLVECKGHREIADGLYFVKECIQTLAIDDPESNPTLEEWYAPGEQLHLSQNAYLLDDEETLLFDTLTPASESAVVEEVETILNGRDLDYLVISHPEANHAGNTGAILRAFPEAELVAPARGSHHDLFDLDEEATFVADGDTIDLGRRTVEFVEPVFYDHAMTTWMRDSATDALFTVDFLGFEHHEDECLACVDEFDSTMTAGRLERFNSYAFTWLRYVDTDETDRAIDALLTDYDPAMIAPAHGQVIREDVTETLELMREAIHDFSEIDPETYHIHTHKMRRQTV